jgi:pimeloyl-ACP methyl ester carboxylesterase
MSMKTRWLARDGGRVAYSEAGRGPLVVCVPGIGDIREEYRFLTPELVRAGYRVAEIDLRGHGESSVGWSDVGPAAIGSDVLALIDELDAKEAVVVGTSKAASAAVWTAAAPDSPVRGIVIIGPFVREVGSAAQRWLYRQVFRVMFNGPWGVGAWMRFWAGLFRSAKPVDFDEYAASLRANLEEPGRLAALRTMMTDTSGGGEPMLPAVHAPALVVMGSADPDFPDPAREASELARDLGGEALTVEGAGHYPHVEAPERTSPAILGFLHQSLPTAPVRAA